MRKQHSEEATDDYRFARPRTRRHTPSALHWRGLSLALALTALCLLPLTPVIAQNDLVFIHHSSGQNWLNDGLHAALVGKSYIDERNDITYGTDMSPDSGRPASLGGTPGDQTDMNHWILWFNDYLGRVRAHGCASGFNQIIMFKSCYPISNVDDVGTEPGDPFSDWQALVNYKALYRHPSGSGNTYAHEGYTYRALEDVFAANPDILFIPVTAPPLCYDDTNDGNAHRARLFNNWLKTDWLNAYNAAHPGLNNVAVFDWFNVLAYADDHASHPSQLRSEYGGGSGNSHPNTQANQDSVGIFATGGGNFLDAAWAWFQSGTGINVDPTVQITSPGNGAAFEAPTDITITATASDTDGTIAKVEFFNGPTWLGQDTTAPYTYAWNGVTAGAYSLTARATDDEGKTGTSAAAAVRVHGPAPQGDYDHDGDEQADLAVFWPNGGDWYVRWSGGNVVYRQNWGWRATIPVPGDYDGDGLTDLAVYWPETGNWYLLFSSGGSAVRNWGWNDTVPVPGDYDNDGRTDLAVHWPDTGNWYIKYSGGGSMVGNWGWNATVPVPGDYDNDGRTDLAVQWPETGNWYIKYSGGGSTMVNWGWHATIPVPGDYNNDGLTDFAVHWRDTGNWYILYNGGGSVVINWGWAATVPVPADYDGDGRIDLAVYWPDTGNWYTRYSNGGTAVANWGWPGAQPTLPQYTINRWCGLLP